MSLNGEKRENRQAFQQERHGSTKAPEVAASVVAEREGFGDAGRPWAFF